MYGVGYSQAVPRDTNILFSSTLKHSDEEFMNSDLYNQNLQLQQNRQAEQSSSGLMRYRSAPSSLFQCLIDGVGSSEDFASPHQSSSPEVDAGFARFASSNGSGGDSEPHNLQFRTALKHETKEQNQYSTSNPMQMIYEASANHPDLVNFNNSVSDEVNLDGVYKVRNGMGMKSTVQGRMISDNSSNLIRQSSSPAGFFSNLTDEDAGSGFMGDAGKFRLGTEASGIASPANMSNHGTNFSSRPSSCLRFMPRIPENGNLSIEGNLGGDDTTSNRFSVTSFQNDSEFTGLKRKRDDDQKLFSSFNALESQNGDARNCATRLTHHLSLPKTSAEMAAVEKYLQFQQDSVPWKIRAKRGCATHPRSIAERVRRTRISEKMRKLQELFPDLDKQMNTADMLDLAVEYIKDLQMKVKTLKDTRAKCTCLSKQKQVSNPTV